jgi:hypothetical protein
VFRYKDRAGHECAYYDTTLLFPFNAFTNGTDGTGTFALDMKKPSAPRLSESLITPAMQTPHESLSFNPKRGLLAAVAGNPFTYPGVVDIYDVHKDCRHPVFESSLPVGIFGHEGNFSPDGKTFYASGLATDEFVAIDVSVPSQPRTIAIETGRFIHGMTISDDGDRFYGADTATNNSGLVILDVSDVQHRRPNPEIREVSHLTWPNVSIPQNAIPVTIKGHPYVVEFDEFARGASGDPSQPVGAGRIIDVANEKHPKVVSNLRLEVHSQGNRPAQANDSGASNGLQGYAAHYCAVPQRHDPGIVACSMILSGLRVFDVRDPYHPKEIAYYNAPRPEDDTNYAMSAPAFAPERGEIWYSDGNLGFFAVRVTNGVWPFRS